MRGSAPRAHAEAAIMVMIGAAARSADRTARRIRERLFFLAGLLACGLDLVFDVRAIEGLAVAVQGPLPRIDGLLVVTALGQQVAEVVLNHRHGRQLLAGLTKRLFGHVELSLPEQRPAETVEIGGIP